MSLGSCYAVCDRRWRAFIKCYGEQFFVAAGVKKMLTNQSCCFLVDMAVVKEVLSKEIVGLAYIGH
ncbi:hypothetical protein AQI70_05625 [Streptomyces curacoi]|uniref:Uncharacterized protein n=1 Tax=Streptomyces curacoi TaxID=146536 RepID=A0A117PHI3_9ACTN|nr:hypothetical protein AQI70_05625 [Streptomyces curacoi]